MTTLTQATALPIVDTIDTLPENVQGIIERHIHGIPTRKTIEEICKDPLVLSYKEKVLKYFLMESSLNLWDLRPLVDEIGSARARVLCQGTASDRANRELRDWKPRWGTTISS